MALDRVQGRSESQSASKVSPGRGEKFLKGLKKVGDVLTLGIPKNLHYLHKSSRQVAMNNPGLVLKVGLGLTLLGGGLAVGGTSLGVASIAVGAGAVSVNPVAGGIALAAGIASGVAALGVGVPTALVGLGIMKEGVLSARWNAKAPEEVKSQQKFMSNRIFSIQAKLKDLAAEHPEGKKDIAKVSEKLSKLANQRSWKAEEVTEAKEKIVKLFNETNAKYGKEDEMNITDLELNTAPFQALQELISILERK